MSEDNDIVIRIKGVYVNIDFSQKLSPDSAGIAYFEGDYDDGPFDGDTFFYKKIKYYLVGFEGTETGWEACVMRYGEMPE
jgi:hypothetical protein